MMNKPITAAISMALLGATMSLYAYPFSGGCSTYRSGTLCGNATLPMVQTSNDTKMKRMTVQNSVNIGGKFSATESSIGSLQTKGDAELSKTTIFGSATINGDFRADKSSMGSVTVSGRTALTQSGVQKSLISQGDFRADSSHIISATVSGAKVDLTHSAVHGLTVKASKAVVCLDDSSVGKLSFTRGNGSVYQTGNSKLVSLTGGKVVQGSCPF